jgi:unsaturated rhamnogalacturonyl hydrolase
VIDHRVAAGRCSRTLLAKAADALIGYPFTGWHYGDSVGFEGLLAASELLEDPSYFGFAHGFMRAWAARGEEHRELDNTAPGHAMCIVCERSDDRLLLEAAVGLARFLLSRRMVAGVYAAFERAPLIEPYDGSALHSDARELLALPGPGVFVDCMHFDPPFLVHLGALCGDQELIDAGAEQALAAVRLLQDPDSGIFNHFYLKRTGRRYGYGWSRGQGWALLGLLDVLELLPGGHRSRAPLAEALRRLAGGLAVTQDRSGHWPALVDVTDAVLEPSAALFFAAGLARGVRLGLLDDTMCDIAARAFAAGLDAVDDAGIVRGVSKAVWACTERGHYLAVPTGEALPWGQGPLLLAAAEFGQAVTA